MKINYSSLSNLANEISLRNDYPYISYSSSVLSNYYYSFADLFEIVAGKENKDYLSDSFLYAEIGDVNKDNEVYPTKIDFEIRNEDAGNESLYKKISKGDILKGEENDILLSKIRPNLKKSIFLDNDKKNIYYTSAFLCLRPKIIPKILFYSLRTIFFDDLLSLARKGKGYPTISANDIKYMKFNKQIIDELLKNKEDILAEIEVLEQEVNSLKKNNIIESEVIDQVFKDKFNFDYKQFNNLKERKQFNVPLHAFTSEPDTRFSAKINRPAGNFVIKQLESITDKRIKDYTSIPIITGKSVSPKDYDEDGEYGYVSMAVIGSWEFDIESMRLVSDSYVEKNSSKRPRGFKESFTTTIEKEDVLMIRSGEGSIGKVAFVEDDVEAVFSDFVMRFRFSNYNSKFAYYYFRISYFQYLVEDIDRRLDENRNTDIEIKNKRAEIESIIKSYIYANKKM